MKFNCSARKKILPAKRIKITPTQTEYLELDNGIVVNVGKTRSFDAAASVLFPFGFKDDLHGSHLLEHLIVRAKKGLKETDSIEREIEVLGGGYQAFTGYDQMEFIVNGVEANTPRIIELLYQSIVNPQIDDETVEEEKTVILGEFQERIVDPEYTLELIHRKNLLAHTYFNQGKERRQGTLKLTTDRIKELTEKYIGGKGVCIGIAGTDTQRLIDKLNDTFGKLPRDIGGRTENFDIGNAKYQEKEISTRRHADNKVSIAFQIGGYKNKYLYANQLLILYLAGMFKEYQTSSRLWKELRDKRRMIYNIKTDLELYSDNLGMGTITCEGILTKNIDDVKKIMLKEIDRLRNSEIPENEFEKCKKALLLSIARDYNGPESEGLAMDLSQNAFYGTEYNYDRITNIFRKQTHEDVMLAARQIFKNIPLSVAIFKGN